MSRCFSEEPVSRAAFGPPAQAVRSGACIGSGVQKVGNGAPANGRTRRPDGLLPERFAERHGDADHRPGLEFVPVLRASALSAPVEGSTPSGSVMMARGAQADQRSPRKVPRTSTEERFQRNSRTTVCSWTFAACQELEQRGVTARRTRLRGADRRPTRRGSRARSPAAGQPRRSPAPSWSPSVRVSGQALAGEESAERNILALAFRRATVCAWVNMLTGCSLPPLARSCVRGESMAATPAFSMSEEVASDGHG